MNLLKARSIRVALVNKMEIMEGKRMLQLFLGQIPEAIYCSLFIILTKKLNEKRCLYIICNIIEYIILINIFKYQLWFDISYFFMSFFWRILTINLFL